MLNLNLFKIFKKKMNEKNSLTNSKNITKKNLIIKKVKNLKQNFQDEHKNKYNIFHSKSGKTAKISPINFHNKIIGYVNNKNNKTNLNIPNMLSKFIEKGNNNSRSKSNPKSKSKKSKEQSRNIKQNASKFNKININKKWNFQNMINYVRNKNSISKTQNNSSNQTKINNKSKNNLDSHRGLLHRKYNSNYYNIIK